MSNTLQLLEVIGTDASLRYGSTATVLERMNQVGASGALKDALANEDCSHIYSDFSDQVESYAAWPGEPQIVHSVWRASDVMTVIR